MDIDDVIQKKKRKENEKKRNPDRILFTFKTRQSAKNTSFFFLQNESTNIKKQRAHMPYFFLIEKSKLTHQHSFYL